MKKIIYSRAQRHLVNKIKKAREEAKLDQKKVAKLLGTTQSYISKMESGQRRIDVIQLKELARIYRKTITYFIR